MVGIGQYILGGMLQGAGAGLAQQQKITDEQRRDDGAQPRQMM